MAKMVFYCNLELVKIKPTFKIDLFGLSCYFSNNQFFMMNRNMQIIECVPNISEGNNLEIVDQIAAEVKSVQGVKLLDIDPGKATNRTVLTFIGPPSEVCEAAFRLVKKAAELIDMGLHHGKHPRFGATDVCPLVPVSGITIEETAEYARLLAMRIGNELGIPVYCYEYAAYDPKRRNLAHCRAGEYEGLPDKLSDPLWKPDFGPSRFNAQVARTGAVAVGARKFLVAYNVNLNTTSARLANSIAFDIRERGRVKRVGNLPTGSIIRDEQGNPLYKPGMLKSVKGMGWYLEDFGIAQLSFNLTDLSVASVHQVFEAACERAAARGAKVTGSELVGMVPLHVMLDAGKHFLRKQRLSTDLPDGEIVNFAIKSLGLNELKPFNPKMKIIEYCMQVERNQLTDLSLKEYVELTASNTVVPAGGSATACIGALGIALGIMVANLSVQKPGWEDRRVFFSAWAEKGTDLKEQLLKLIDEDTRAYHHLMEVFRLPKNSDEETALRKLAIEEATRKAIAAPFQVMQVCCDSMEVLHAMVENGNPNCITDAGVGALAVRAAMQGAYLNIRFNSKRLYNKDFVHETLSECAAIERTALEWETKIMTLINLKIS